MNWYYVGMTIAIVLAIVCFVILIAAIDASVDYYTRPKAKLEYCIHHGLFKREHGLPLPGTTARMCPVCFHDSMKNATRVK